MTQEEALSAIVAQMPNARSEIVQRSLSVARRLDLAQPIQPMDVARADGFTDEELRMMNIFIDPAFNNGRIYLAPEIVRAYLINASTWNDTSIFFRDTLRAKYQLGIDYFSLDPQNGIDQQIIQSYKDSNFREKSPKFQKSRGRPTSLFYAVTGHCFQELIMQANTSAGAQLRALYIRLVSLVPVFTQLINFAQMIILKQQATIQQQEMQAITQSRQLAIEDAEQSRHRAEEEQRKRELAESRYVHMRTLVQSTKRPVREEWIYIATSPSLALQDHFKPGRTDSLRARLISYNGGRAEGDLMFYTRAWRCYYAMDIELLIRRSLKSYADKGDKEMVVLPFELLLRKIEGFINADLCSGEVDTLFIDNFDAYMSATRSVPSGINLDDLEPRPVVAAAAAAMVPAPVTKAKRAPRRRTIKKAAEVVTSVMTDIPAIEVVTVVAASNSTTTEDADGVEVAPAISTTSGLAKPKRRYQRKKPAPIVVPAAPAAPVAPSAPQVTPATPITTEVATQMSALAQWVREHFEYTGIKTDVVKLITIWKTFSESPALKTILHKEVEYTRKSFYSKIKNDPLLAQYYCKRAMINGKQLKKHLNGYRAKTT